jgi:hypothetical protein
MKKHGDIDVEVTYEGIATSISTGAIYMSKDGALYIDANHSIYSSSKNDFAVDPTEGNDGG